MIDEEKSFLNLRPGFGEELQNNTRAMQEYFTKEDFYKRKTANYLDAVRQADLKYGAASTVPFVSFRDRIGQVID